MPKGIPHSVFLDWLPNDQDKALAFVRYENRRCPKCRTHEEDWEHDGTAFVGWQKPPCPGCMALHDEERNVQNSSGTDAQKAAVPVVLIPKQLALKLIEQGEEGALG